MVASTFSLKNSFSSVPQKKTADVIETLQSLCCNDLEALNGVILTHIERDVPLISTIAKHLILAGGKRLRPLLAFSSYRLLTAEQKGNETPSKMVELAASIEFIHNATLLHDDVIDESPLRRNRPTANALWGNKPSILVGDFLFAKAFELMLGENEKRVLPILATVAQIITEGEVFQLSYLKTFALDFSILMRIIETKTAALFAASCEIGAALLNTTTEIQQALHHFGHHLGIAFQIIDDVLDYTGDTESLGKNIGDDVMEGKVTLPLFFTYQKCSAEDQKMLEQMLESEKITEDDFAHIIELMHKTDAIKECYDLAWAYAEKAAMCLDMFKEGEIKNALSDLCYSLVMRQN